MVLNEALDVRYGEIGQDSVYSKEELIWPSDNNYLYNIEDNKIDLIYYFGDKIKVRVPKKLDRKIVTVIDESCYNYNKNITSVIIKNNIKEIK